MSKGCCCLSHFDTHPLRSLYFAYAALTNRIFKVICPHHQLLNVVNWSSRLPLSLHRGPLMDFFAFHAFMLVLHLVYFWLDRLCSDLALLYRNWSIYGAWKLNLVSALNFYTRLLLSQRFRQPYSVFASLSLDCQRKEVRLHYLQTFQVCQS